MPDSPSPRSPETPKTPVKASGSGSYAGVTGTPLSFEGEGGRRRKSRGSKRGGKRSKTRSKRSGGKRKRKTRRY